MRRCPRGDAPSTMHILDLPVAEVRGPGSGEARCLFALEAVDPVKIWVPYSQFRGYFKTPFRGMEGASVPALAVGTSH